MPRMVQAPWQVGVVTRKSGKALARVESARSPEDEGDPLRARRAHAPRWTAAHDPHGLPARPGPPLRVPMPHSRPLCAPRSLRAKVSSARRRPSSATDRV